MSLIASSWAWKQRTHSPSMKLLLMALADQARECGHVWPSLKTISDRVGVEVRQVRKNIVRLGDMELVEKIPQTRDDGGATSNLFRLPFDPEPCNFECRGYAPSVLADKGGVSSGTGEPLSSETGASMNRKSEPKKKIKKKREQWNAPLALPWAEGLRHLSLVHEDHPDQEWLEDVQGNRHSSHMKLQVDLFIDYYNAPGTRDLKAWKTAFRTWIQRSVEQIDSSDPRAVVMHDTSLPKGECMCRMCLRRAKTG